MALVGLGQIVGWALVYAGGGGTLLWRAGGLLLYLTYFAIAVVSMAAVAWLAVDSVRKFRRCRAARTA